MNILHLNILKGIVPPAIRRNDAQKRDTLAPFYFLGGMLLITLVVLPLLWRVLELIKIS